MFTFKEYVPASSIWPNASDKSDLGEKYGYFRGYNIEVKDRFGNLSWLSCEYIHSDPNIVFNDDFHQFYFNEHQWEPTGRICFRGYGSQEFDCDENEIYIIEVNFNE